MAQDSEASEAWRAHIYGMAEYPTPPPVREAHPIDLGKQDPHNKKKNIYIYILLHVVVRWMGTHTHQTFQSPISFMRVDQNPEFGLLHPVAPAKMTILQATPWCEVEASGAVPIAK